MRSLVILMLIGKAVAADVGSPSTWPSWKDAKLGIALKRPAAAKVVSSKGTITISGAELATVTITVAPSDDRGTNKNGGVSGTHVEYTIDAPKRHATCTADSDDKDKADVASYICDSIALTPGAKHPHVELQIESDGLADGAAFEKSVRAKQGALDACWKKALAKDKELPEGSVSLDRTYDHGKPSQSNTHLENFFDHDAKAFGACVSTILAKLPAKTAADTATTKVEVIGQYY